MGRTRRASRPKGGRIVPEHFNQLGRPKRAFPNPDAVRKFLQDQGWTGLYGYYRCEMCGDFHITSKTGVSKRDLSKRYM